MKYVLKISEQKSKNKHFKPKSHQKFDKYKHIIFSHKDIDLNDLDGAFCLYIIEHNKNFDYYLVKCEFKIVFIDHEDSPYVTSKLSENKTMIPWKKSLEKVTDDFKDKS